MAKGNFKQIDLLRKRRKTNYLLEPYFVDTKKYIRKGILSGLILIVITLILGTPFIFRIRFLENRIKKIKPFSDEYNLLVKKLDKETTQLQAISKFNNDLKNSIINISSSSALFQEIALIIPEDIQLLEFITKGDSLFMKAKLSNDAYLETLNSFLLNLDESDLIKFNIIDLKEINILEDNPKETAYLVDLETRISTEYSDINAKYLIKLGSYGLFNRLRLLKGIEEPLK